MSKAHKMWLIVAVLFIISVAMSAFADPAPRTNVPPGGLWIYNTASGTWIPAAGDILGQLKTITGTTTITLPNPLITQISNPGSITATVALPVASSAVSAPADALPVMLYANDNSALQRLFTAIVQGDGVNGNNMLPGAGYYWNGASWDRVVGSATDGLKVNGSVSVTSAPTTTVVGSSTGTPLPITDPKAYTAASSTYAQYYVALATNSVTLLSSIASFTVPCEIVFYHNAATYYGPATTASATLQTGHKKVADAEWSIKPQSALFDMAFIAAPAAAGSLTVTIFPLTVAP